MTGKISIRTVIIVTLFAVLTEGVRVAYAQGTESVIYTTSDINQELAQTYRGRSLAVDDFLPQLYATRLLLTNRLEIGCTPESGLVNQGEYSEIAKFLRDALVSELFELGAHAANANVRISGNLTEVQADVNKAVNDNDASGSWSFSLSLRSSLGKSANFTAIHSFKLENTVRYCGEMTAQFVPGVQVLVKSILDSKEFLELVTS